MGDITFMDCWHFIAPLIPTKALKDAEEHRKNLRGIENEP